MYKVKLKHYCIYSYVKVELMIQFRNNTLIYCVVIVACSISYMKSEYTTNRSRSKYL